MQKKVGIFGENGMADQAFRAFDDEEKKAAKRKNESENGEGDGLVINVPRLRRDSADLNL